MPRFAANLTMMFTEWDFLDRFAAAADAGFAAVEFAFPYEFAPDAVAARIERSGLVHALFNSPPGNQAAGERGIAALPGRFAEFQASIRTALTYATATGATRLHVMAGIADRDDPAVQAAFRQSIGWAAGELARQGVELMIEPINKRDVPGYFLDDFAVAETLIRELGAPNLKLQFDIYHRQILHGDVTMALRRLLPIIGHVQIAGVPSRHEPAGEELDAAFLFAELDRIGYGGFVGAEYRPRGRTLDGLGWFAPYAAKRG